MEKAHWWLAIDGYVCLWINNLIALLYKVVNNRNQTARNMKVYDLMGIPKELSNIQLRGCTLLPVNDTGSGALAAEFTFIYHGFLESTTAVLIDNSH